jgi:hypothetical protein
MDIRIDIKRVIIAGSRTFADYELLCKKCDIYLSSLSDIEIVSGAANGADRLGEKYARSKGYPIKQFFANWEEYGKSAGYRRNEEMAKYAHALIIFWDRESRGSKHMIDLAKKYNLAIKIVSFFNKN